MHFPPLLVVLPMVIILFAVMIYSPFRLLSWMLFLWIEENKWRYFMAFGFSIIFMIIAMIGFVFGHFRGEKFGRILLHISTNIIVFSFTGLFPCLICEIVFGVFSKTRDYSVYIGGGLTFIILLYMAIGLILGGKAHIKTIEVRSSSTKIPLRVVHISDTHLGSHGESFFTDIVNKTNSLNPDIVCITGDLVDSMSLVKNDSLEADPKKCCYNIHEEMRALRDLHAKYGVYFVFGNHDFMCGEEQVMKILKEYPNVCILRNEIKNVIIPATDETPQQHLRFIGIDDCSEKQFDLTLREVLGISSSHSSFSQGPISEVSPSISPSSFTILLHHRPLTHLWKDMMKMCGADMMLVGHTHKGQTFPVWPLVLLVFRPYGGLHMLENYDDRSNEEFKEHTPLLYVSPGTGTWGTNLRTASRNEITFFKIKPNSSL